jgi:hypothetical protein
LPLIFLFRFVGELLLLEGLALGTSTYKYFVVMGGSFYKDLIRLLQGNIFLNDTLLRMKGEDAKTLK